MNMTYEQKKKIADNYLDTVTGGGLSWDCLPDINSLHDCETEEDIRYSVDERLEDSGFPMDLLFD